MAVVIGEVKPGFLQGHPEHGVVIPLPPQNGGAVGWGNVYLSFAAEFGDALLRVAIWNGGSWRLLEPLSVTQKGGRVTVTIQDGDQKVSVGRLQADDKDTGLCPVSYLLEATLKA